MTREEEMNTIINEVLHLTVSPLYTYRTSNKYQPVIGEGPLDAKIVFIGEAPGKNEALTGKPFCGAAGKFLDTMLQSADINRSVVYITNIVKDRPPENRDPTPEEVALYGPFLLRQLSIIKPSVIATLGRFSTKYMLEKFGSEKAALPISTLHGQALPFQASYGKVMLVPLFHPASALYNPGNRGILIEDMKKVVQAIS